ncbi:MAG: N-formylglutamate deformylase [Xanthomonadales bacterium]|nr:N-formylglutamate deformylase [Xanthomonadales bacterium]
MKPVFTYRPGTSPLLISVPHSGTHVPDEIFNRFTSKARDLQDTDWYVDRLYDWANQFGAGILVANYSRFVIDLNRAPDNTPLYPGHGTGLLPTQCFDGSAVYQVDMQPDKKEENHRLQKYWQPYHDQLRSALDEIRQTHGYALLLDAHSILTEVPLLFEGKLPDLNLGSYRGASAEHSLISACFSALSKNSNYSSVLDGRFQGGYITRHYGQPNEGIHALQLEMAQHVYMSEQPPVYDPDLAKQVSVVLQGLVGTLIQWSPA